MELTIVVVEDEYKVRQVLIDLLARFCPGVKLLGEASNVDEAQELITRLRPDLIFLDIEMPGGNGFELLARFSDPFFETIFVTSYSHYAIRAIRFSAMDYLLKPVLIEDLQQAVERARQKIGERGRAGQYGVLKENLESKGCPEKLVLNNRSNLEYVRTDEIMYFEGDSNYTHIYLRSGKKHCVSRTLKEYEQILCVEGSSFVRIHKTYIVNLAFAKALERGEQFGLVLRDDTRLEVSRRKKSELLSKMR